MLLGVFLHAAASFVVTPAGWAVRDRTVHLTADVTIGIIHLFRMPVFFLLSGFFARLLYLRLGIRSFIRHRVQRILVPLAVALPFLLPTLDALWGWGASQQAPQPVGHLAARLPTFDLGTTMVSGFGHLWFLYYLAILLAIVLCVVAAARNQPLQRIAHGVDTLFSASLRHRCLSVLIAVPVASTLCFMALPGLADTPLGLVPQPRLLAFYGLFLAAGWFLHRQRDLLPELARRLWIPLVVIAAAAGPFAVWAVHEVFNGPADRVIRVFGFFLGALLTCELTLLLIGAFLRYLSRPVAWVRWLSDASYWCYLVHLPMVVVLQILVARLSWPAATKYVLIISGALSVSLLTYQVFVRYTAIGTVLNGKRQRPGNTHLAATEVRSEAG